MQSRDDGAFGQIVGGDFRIIRRVAEGGMGTVFEAEQLSTGARRALKVLRAPPEEESRWRPLFEREVKLASAVESDHVAYVVGAGIDPSLRLPWIAMELLEGEDLSQRLHRDAMLDIGTVRVIAQQMGHALGAAHRAQIVHRDIKPANVYLAKSRTVGLPFVVKLLDFGIAKWLTESSVPTPNLGTPSYMAPEQCGTGDLISPATDVWALGLLVFRMLTGHSFWLSSRAEAPAIAALMREVLSDPIPRASERVKQIDDLRLELPGFDAWFDQCLQRAPGARFASATEACEALDELLLAAMQHTSVALRSHAAEPTVPLEPEANTALESPRALNERAMRAPSSAVRRRFRVQYRDVSRQYAVDVAPDEDLLSAVHRAGAPLFAECGGNALCTTCRVSVIDGLEHASARDGNESTVAQHRGWPLSTRLSCQLKVRGPMTVRRMVSTADDAPIDSASTSVRHRNPPEHLVVVQATLVGIEEFSRKHLTFDTLHVLERFAHQMIEPSLPNGARVLSTHAAGVLLGYSTTARTIEAAVEAALRSALRMLPRLRHINQYTQRHFGHRFSLAVGIDIGDVVLVEMSVVPGKDPAFIGHAVLGANRAAMIAARESASIVVTDKVRALLREVKAGPEFVDRAERFSSVIDFDKPDVAAVVQETYELVLERKDEFSLAMCRRFLSDPSVAAMFAESDMGTQRAMLMGVLHRAVRALDRFESVEGELRALGRRHAALGVEPAQFRVLGQAVIETLREFLGPALNHDAELAWMELYTMLARAMIDGAHDA
jgi:serine/threonine protein kinase/hemoglobin-like flavoprotein